MDHSFADRAPKMATAAAARPAKRRPSSSEGFFDAAPGSELATVTSPSRAAWALERRSKGELPTPTVESSETPLVRPTEGVSLRARSARAAATATMTMTAARTATMIATSTAPPS